MIKIINAIEGNVTSINLEYKDITLNELMSELKINKIYIGAVLVNGTPKKLTESFEDNSEIYVLPALEGGC